MLISVLRLKTNFLNSSPNESIPKFTNISLAQGSSLTFSLAGQSGQPKSGLAGPQLVWLARDTFIGLGQPIIITIY